MNTTPNNGRDRHSAGKLSASRYSACHTLNPRQMSAKQTQSNIKLFQTCSRMETLTGVSTSPHHQHMARIIPGPSLCTACLQAQSCPPERPTRSSGIIKGMTEEKAIARIRCTSSEGHSSSCARVLILLLQGTRTLTWVFEVSNCHQPLISLPGTRGHRNDKDRMLPSASRVSLMQIAYQ